MVDDGGDRDGGENDGDDPRRSLRSGSGGRRRRCDVDDDRDENTASSRDNSSNSSKNAAAASSSRTRKNPSCSSSHCAGGGRRSTKRTRRSVVGAAVLVQALVVVLGVALLQRQALPPLAVVRGSSDANNAGVASSSADTTTNNDNNRGGGDDDDDDVDTAATESRPWAVVVTDDGEERALRSEEADDEAKGTVPAGLESYYVDHSSRRRRFDGEDGHEKEGDGEGSNANNANDIIVIATVDGTLAGLRKSTGEILWKRSRNDDYSGGGARRHRSRGNARAVGPEEALRGGDGAGGDGGDRQEQVVPVLLNPLVSTTTTTAKTPSNEEWRTSAVPSIDGSVYLTASTTASSSSAPAAAAYSNRYPEGGGGVGDDLDDDHVTQVTTTMRDLVARAPFVDGRGRIYTASTHATAFSIDGLTGEILHASSADRQTPATTAGTNRAGSVVWLGRVDSSVSIHDPRSGLLDVSFSSSRIVSIRDMLLGNDSGDEAPRHHRSPPPRLEGEQLHHRPGGKTFAERRSEFLSSPSSTSDPTLSLVATPNGNVAYRNPTTGVIEWVADECFETPVAFAIDSATGSSLGVDIIPDAVLPNGSTDYVTKEMERQMELVLTSTEEEEASSDDDEQTIVGALPSSGELFAVPLGRRPRRPPGFASSSVAHRLASAVHNTPPSKSFHVASHLSSSSDADTSLGGGLGHRKHGCRPGSPSFPACVRDGTGLLHHEYEQDGAMVQFYRPDYGYIPPKNYYTLKDGIPSKNQWRYNKMLRIFGSWLPPTIALIFVVSFELGRRKRQQEAQNRLELESSHITQQIESHKTEVGVIEVFDDVILGYGGHGTVVYKGMLEGRQVAVKRMLKAYLPSADREISLLIESDGHPNVVRYFLKEVRGDFVYLALELCDLSLHDLIATLRGRCDSPNGGQFEKENVAPCQVSASTKSVLHQIASGVRHLHHLRIVHRDLKPMNILLADARKKSKQSGESVLDIFDHGDYVAKISDMGLGKQLVGQSSYGASFVGEASLRGASNGAESSVVGPGPGSVGWQAPEVMSRRAPSDSSVRSDGSSDGLESSPIVNAINAHSSRSSDIFSLGCIFYSTLLPGSHPFGEWYEREANIMHNRPNIEALKNISPDAYDLVGSMIQRNQSARPTAKQVCEHPLFWPPDRRLAFLCDVSDRLESEAPNAEGEAPTSSFAAKSLAIERNASKVVGLAWDSLLDKELIGNVQKFRTYDPSSVRDLLRLIRNKHHHFDELPSRIKESMVSNTDGLLEYFEARFPRLLIHCYSVFRDILPSDDPISVKYSILPRGRVPPTKRLNMQVSKITEGTEATPSELQIDDEPFELSIDTEPQKGIEACGPDIESDIAENATGKQNTHIAIDNNGGDEPKDPAVGAVRAPASLSDQKVTEEPSNKNEDGVQNEELASLSILAPPVQLEPSDSDDLVIWEGSTAAKTLNCRGWLRSDSEWERRADFTLRKRDNTLVRCAEDPRFRTRLCNHWDESGGTFCPMRKKGKCIFAHGPVELRVKEGKRSRWGQLVDKNGDNKNPKHSGGEDTYGAARSIETERKQEGKWNTGNSKKKIGKQQQPKGRKNTSSGKNQQKKVSTS